MITFEATYTQGGGAQYRHKQTFVDEYSFYKFKRGYWRWLVGNGSVLEEKVTGLPLLYEPGPLRILTCLSLADVKTSHLKTDKDS